MANMNIKLWYCFVVLVIVPMIAIRVTSGDENKASDSAAAQKEGYVFSIRTEKKVYRPDEKIDLVLALKNIGEKETHPGSEAFLKGSKFLVHSPSGEITPLTAFGKQWLDPLNSTQRMGGSYMYSFKPGEVLENTLGHFNRIFDMTLSGTYKISASISVPKRDGTKEYVVITTNILEIKIAENADKLNNPAAMSVESRGTVPK